MELKDLTGLHKLTGVSFGSLEIEKEFSGKETVNSIVIILDNKSYMAIENPDDGYRSSMREIIQLSKNDGAIKVNCEVDVKNKFQAQRVFATMRQGTNDEILDVYDVHTGKIVLAIGTSNYDDYYPCFIYEFVPENMLINKDKHIAPLVGDNTCKDPNGSIKTKTVKPLPKFNITCSGIH